MTTSNSNKILVFFVLTFLFNLLVEEIQHFYHLVEHLKISLITPGIVAILLIIYYEVPGTLNVFIRKRIKTAWKPTIIQIIVSLIPIFIIPISFFLYKYFYNSDATISEIKISSLLWPLIGVFFEELGWRGYFQYKAGGFIHMLIATLLTGFLWFVVQIDLYIDDPFYGVVSLVFYLSNSVILSYLFFLSNRNLILCYVYRTTQLIIGGIFISQSIKDINFMFIMTPFYICVAAIVLVLNKELFQIDPNDKL